FEYMWSDTCCMDRSSISGLSEAINSMYTLYEKSTSVMFILTTSWAVKSLSAGISIKNGWLKRGWTLQELM
ncbi:hypothetical protein GQ43DRAFT_368104, partial [Delitschia confertaspora ATCC 74209]